MSNYIVLLLLTRALDMVGRRPVIIIGTAGLSVSTILLGITSSLPHLLIARCLGALYSVNFILSPPLWSTFSGYIFGHCRRASLGPG